MNATEIHGFMLLFPYIVLTGTIINYVKVEFKKE